MIQLLVIGNRLVLPSPLNPFLQLLFQQIEQLLATGRKRVFKLKTVTALTADEVRKLFVIVSVPDMRALLNSVDNLLCFLVAQLPQFEQMQWFVYLFSSERDFESIGCVWQHYFLLLGSHFLS